MENEQIIIDWLFKVMSTAVIDHFTNNAQAEFTKDGSTYICEMTFRKKESEADGMP